MNQVMIVLSEGTLSPQLCRISVGADDTRYSVIQNLDSKLCPGSSHGLDNPILYRVPSSFLWGNILDINLSQFTVTQSDEELMSTNQEGFTFFSTHKSHSNQQTLRTHVQTKGQGSVVKRTTARALGSVTETHSVSTGHGFSTTLERSLQTCCDVNTYDCQCSNFTQSQEIQVNTPPHHISFSSEPKAIDVVYVSDSEDDQQDDCCILSGFYTPKVQVKHKKYDASNMSSVESRITAADSVVLDPSDNDDSAYLSRESVFSDVEMFESTVSCIKGTGVHIVERGCDDARCDDEGIVLDRQWEDSCDTSDAVESEDVKAKAARSMCVEGDAVKGMESEDVNGEAAKNESVEGDAVKSDDVMIVKVEDASQNSNRQLIFTYISKRFALMNKLISTPVVRCCGVDLTQADLDTLKPHCWLNDQVINSYMRLLVATYGCEHKVHIMNTFFYTKLSRAGYSGVEKWLKRVRLNKLRLLLVPVHLDMHWCIAAIDFRLKRIQYFDSLGGTNHSCLKRLRWFLVRCRMAGKLGRRRTMCWKLCHAKQIPRQCNGSDCGVFICQFARWLCSVGPRSAYSKQKIPFTQKHMPRIRMNMLEELRTGRLLPHVHLHDGNLRNHI